MGIQKEETPKEKGRKEKRKERSALRVFPPPGRLAISGDGKKQSRKDAGSLKCPRSGQRMSGPDVLGKLRLLLAEIVLSLSSEKKSDNDKNQDPENLPERSVSMHRILTSDLTY